MRELIDMSVRVIAAMVAGAGLAAMAMAGSNLLPPGGLADSLGGWPLLVALAALLCGVCALAMSSSLIWRGRHLVRLTSAALAASALAWGVCLSAATSRTGWERVAGGAPWLVPAIAPLVTAGASIITWLLLYAALAGLLAGAWPHTISATRRALTPVWLTPLWGAGVGAVYGLLFASVFYMPPCRPPGGFHCYGLDTTLWDGLRTGLALGIGAGLILSLTLALALRLALALCPAPADQGRPHATTLRHSEV